jgi:hypothetical protein
MVARVGDDLFGPPTIQNFKALGIGARHIKMVKAFPAGWLRSSSTRAARIASSSSKEPTTG